MGTLLNPLSKSITSLDVENSMLINYRVDDTATRATSGFLPTPNPFQFQVYVYSFELTRAWEMSLTRATLIQMAYAFYIDVIHQELQRNIFSSIRLSIWSRFDTFPPHQCHFVWRAALLSFHPFDFSHLTTLHLIRSISMPPYSTLFQIWDSPILLLL